jgi:hypothetical protein
VLHAIWAAEGQSGADLDEDCSPTKVCKNMRTVTFDGLAEPGSDLTGAWRDRLAREGKLNASGGSIRDLVLGPADSR